MVGIFLHSEGHSSAEPGLHRHCFLAVCVDLSGLGAGSSFLQQVDLDPYPIHCKASETQPAEQAKVIPLASKDV